MDKIIFRVEKENAGIRIDKYLSDNMEDISRSYLQKLLKEKSITVNEKEIKANYKVQEGDVVSVSVPEPEEPDILPLKKFLLIFSTRTIRLWWSISRRIWWFTQAPAIYLELL